MGLEETHPPPDVDRLLDGRYRLGRLLGRGGAASVYEAVDTVLGRSVAVKFYQPSSHAVGLYRFVAEARLLASLSHPGLVMVYDVSLDGDQPYLVMRLVNGPTLRDLLDRGPLEPAAVARLGTQLAEVLAYVHGKDVVHRDIKPSNVLVDETGTSYLADFGIARALSATHLTVSGEFVGTAAYLAPEQVTDVDTGPPVDIYALGLLLLECLTGRTEYTGTTIESALARLSRPPRIPETLSPAWHTVLTAMTAQDPAARPDAHRCAQLLTTIAEDATAVIPPEGATAVLTPEPEAPTPPVPEPEPTQAHARPAARLLRPVPAAMGVTVLAAAAAAVFALSSSPTVPGVPGGDSRPTSTQPAPPGQEVVADPAESTATARGTDEQTVPAVNADLPANPSRDTPATPSPSTTDSPSATPTSTPPTTEPTTTEQPEPTTTPSEAPEQNNGGGNSGNGNSGGNGGGKGKG